MLRNNYNIKTLHNEVKIMLLFYLRHGDPTYNPDELTPLGKRQAEALAKRLALYGIDEIYASTSNRAIQTAQPTCEVLKKEMTQLDFANERYAWEDLAFETEEGGRTWGVKSKRLMELASSQDVMSYYHNWYDHPDMQEFGLKKGLERISAESDKFLFGLGYEHIKDAGKYKAVKPNDKRVALFAHWGFGMAFLSSILDIPYPMLIKHFDMCHTGMTVIEFKEKDGYAIPKILTLSSDSHIYKEGLPTNYNNEIRF